MGAVMLTIREARQRLAVHGMELRRHIENCKWAVMFREDRDERNMYVTDDLDDAVIQGGRMRKTRIRAI